MRTLLNMRPSKNLLIILAIAALFGSVLFTFGCAPTTQQVNADSESARLKTKQDSLKNTAYVFELNKTWSTAYEYYKNKTYASSIKPFWRVIELDTIDRFKDKYSLLSDAYTKLNLPDSAQHVLELGVTEYPGNAYLHRTLAYFYDGRGRVEDAIREYETATEIDDKQISDWKALGNLYIKSDEAEKAIKAFEKVSILDPKNQDAQRTLSRLYKSTGDSNAAIKRMEQIKKLDPKNVENILSLGREYFTNGDYDKAIVNFEQLLQIKPGDASAMEYLGNALQNKGNYSRAINIYKEIMKITPDNKKLLTDIATSYKGLGRFEEARSNARRALQIDSNYGLAYIVIGEIYEAAAEKCYTARGKKSPEFDDKLIYDLAYKQYEKATADLQFKDIATRRMSYINNFRPTREDLFFHKNQTKPKDPCYNWIF